MLATQQEVEITYQKYVNTIVVAGGKELVSASREHEPSPTSKRINRRNPTRRRGALATSADKQGLHTRAVFYPSQSGMMESRNQYQCVANSKRMQALIERPFLEDSKRTANADQYALGGGPPRVSRELPFPPSPTLPSLSDHHHHSF